MTDSELQQARAHKWRLDGQSVRTLDDARSFLESVGFCLMYPDAACAPAADFHRSLGGCG